MLCSMHFTCWAQGLCLLFASDLYCEGYVEHDFNALQVVEAVGGQLEVPQGFMTPHHWPVRSSPPEVSSCSFTKLEKAIKVESFAATAFSLHVLRQVTCVWDLYCGFCPAAQRQQ